MVVWKGREMYSAGEITREEFVDYISRGYVGMHSSDMYELTAVLEHHPQDIATPWALRQQ